MNLEKFSKMKGTLLVAAVYLMMPAMAFATNHEPNISNIEGLVQDIGSIVSMLIPIVAGLAVLFFFYGLAKYILAAGDEESQLDGKSIMVKGLIAIFIIAALWGIIEVLGSMLGIDPNDDSSLDTIDIEGI